MTTTSTDRQYSAGTVDDGAEDRPLWAAGKKSGHGAIAWLPAPDYDMDTPDPWPPEPGRHPVIALLDTGVEAHNWLPDQPDDPASAAGDPAFVIDAEKLGWSGPDLDDLASAAVQEAGFGSHLIHGTFMAGLIRLNAPNAQIVSMRVMNQLGKVNNDDVVSALTWLAHPPVRLHVDIVLMAFGTPADATDSDQIKLNAAMLGLGGVQFVCSAGNQGSDRTVYPAAFAVDKQLNVASVGAVAVGAPTERAPYSNYGPWVTKWRNGTNIISLAPLTTKALDDKEADARAGLVPYTVSKTGYGYAWWSGTSFAAALYAAELAKRMSPAAGAPEPAAGS
jgi:Subtilase family